MLTQTNDSLDEHSMLHTSNVGVDVAVEVTVDVNVVVGVVTKLQSAVNLLP